MKHFYSSFLVTFLGIIVAFYFGGFLGIYLALLLAILEVSLSFDNAVVNAKILSEMDPIWQKRFITLGIPIAVFGMRFLFPILIVSIVANLGLYETFLIALNKPELYKTTLESSQNLIYSFGGAFLLMVFLHFFFDGDRREHWIGFLENNKIRNKLSKVNSIELIISIGVGLILVNITKSSSIALSYFSGIFIYSLINALDDFLATNGVRAGIAGFIYLEVLDASFSFDGVIGAFAISSNLFIIMIGLGIGAMFVRSLTLFLVEKKTLNEYVYLEHGAHYAILVLSLIMFLEIFIHISEIIIGTLGIGIIFISFLHSLKERKILKK